MSYQKYLFLTLFLMSFAAYSQSVANPLLSPDAERQQQWVDSIYNQMSPAEKVGQLFMVAAYSNRDSIHIKQIDSLIIKHHIGGLIFFQGGPQRQVRLTNHYQQISKLPLLIGMDAEWGLSMRLDSTYRFPYNMTLGAIRDKSWLIKLGKRVGEHSKRMGVHINFAPVLDINTNPKNPIIGNRSFGEAKDNVYESAKAFMQGMQAAGVLANGKHFPGHGDTDTDSHKTLPIVNHDLARLDSVELYPYKKIFADGLASVMVAHLNVPVLEPRAGYPSSISYNIVTNLLKDKLLFKGLIFTDALNMKGASNFDRPGDIDMSAFLAGNDVLLFSEDVPTASAKILDAYQNGAITEERMALSVKKILKAKYKVGLASFTEISTENLVSDLNQTQDDVLQYELYDNAITLLKNKKDLLPIENLKNTKIAYIKIGDDDETPFLETLKKYTRIDVVDIKNPSEISKLKPYDVAIIGYHKSDASAYRKNDFTNGELLLIKEIAQYKKSILSVFARPYVLTNLTETSDLSGLILSYQNNPIAQSLTAQAIFGATSFKGRLPVTVSDEFQVGFGLDTHTFKRLGYAFPEQVGLNSKILSHIDSLAKFSIENRVTPGMQVLVARKGKVVYNKSFGYQTYENTKAITDTTLYDLASLTKILATLPMVMEAYEARKITFNTTLGELLPELRNSNKRNISLMEVLSHYGRLKPWIPFYLETLENSKTPSNRYYRTQKEGVFNVQVAHNLYLREDYKDTMYALIAESPLQSKLEYKYSDLPFLILKKYIESTYDAPLEDLTQDYFYKSLGANYTTFRPLEKFDDNQIAPTEIDTYFRHQEIRGYVHDMGAAMLNGVGGHAGLFSTANDIAKIMQMYLQYGFYGNEQLLQPGTLNAFNACHYCDKGIRRGIGFDKPQRKGGDTPTCGCVSLQSFGHQGFTGTFTWADPEADIVYVFLSNRTYPDANVNKLSKERIREKIQQVIYDAIFE
jgi:beta-glucosidase-like glycosyl hydrolase/CubicO group peptidase (beta-lactamase class C family)